MFPYNIVEDQGRDVLALAREKGIGTIAMKPLPAATWTNGIWPCGTSPPPGSSTL